MRSLLTLACLCLIPLPASADTITTTDGKRYTKAVDGFYYPSAHVRPNGSVGPTPLRTAAPVCPCSSSCSCPSGTCPMRCPVQSAPMPAPQVCPGGNCPAPSRGGLFFNR